MLLMSKDKIKYLFPNYQMVSCVKQGYEFLKYIDIPAVRAHHLAKGLDLDSYIKEQDTLIIALEKKIENRKSIKKMLMELKK